MIRAVDEYVLAALRADLPQHEPSQSSDPVAKFGNRVVTMVADHPDIMDYLVRALIEESEFGALVFDDLVTRGQARWENLKEQRIARPDLDVTWAAVNPIILTLGAILMRSHIERHLSGPLYSPEELQRWEDAVSSLMHRGQLRPGDGTP